MLAPLENRRALADSPVATCDSGEVGARQIMTLNAEISRLQSLCEQQAQQIARYAAGTVIVDLGRKLLALSEANARLLDDSQRAAMLERALGIADAERRRLSLERDALVRTLARSRQEHPGGTSLLGACHVRASR